MSNLVARHVRAGERLPDEVLEALQEIGGLDVSRRDAETIDRVVGVLLGALRTRLAILRYHSETAANAQATAGKG